MILMLLLSLVILKIISLKGCAPGSKLSMQGAPASNLGLHSESLELQNLSKKIFLFFYAFFFQI